MDQPPSDLPEREDLAARLEPTELSALHESVAWFLATGKTLKIAAQEAGCHRSIAWTISKRREVRKRIGGIRQVLLSDSNGQLTASLTKAAEVLVELCGDEDPNVRLKAARSIFDTLFKVRHVTEHEQQMPVLEEELESLREALATVTSSAVSA